jgi:hypothetical protein
MSAKYSIRVAKDGVNVRARYDIGIPMDTPNSLRALN